MDGMTGIQPTYNLADRGCYDGFGGNSGLWLFAILALMNGGFGWGARAGYGVDGRCATVEDLNTTSNFARLEGQVQGISSDLASGFRNVDNAVCSLGYESLKNFGDLSKQIADCCCENRLATQQTKFDMANYASALEKTIITDGQKTRDLIQANKIETLQAKVNQLELAQATCGMPRFTTNYTIPSCNPFASFAGYGCGYGCNGTNI